MLEKIKESLHFPIARYFLFFAGIKLKRWNPKVIVVTGSSGKTTLLHLIEAQLKKDALYSHKANSPYGIAFNILGLKRKTLNSSEWFGLFLKAPFKTFSKLPQQKIYVVEADCDRPKEGKIMSNFLKPNMTVWVSVSKTHAGNFDHLVPNKFSGVIEAISYEYGYYLENTSGTVFVNTDDQNILKQLERTKAETRFVSTRDISFKYAINRDTTTFNFSGTEVVLPALEPEEVSYSVLATKLLVENLGGNFDSNFSGFKSPPGRSSVFSGIKNTTLVDSTYNSNLGSAQAILGMFSKLETPKSKWVVLGDMYELGKSAKEEHEKLAEEVKKLGFDKIFLFGDLCREYALPIIKEAGMTVLSFTDRQKLLTAIYEQIKEGEFILFKGSQSCQLDAILEKLLARSSDSMRLPRQEEAWQNRRKAMNLKLA